MFHDYKIAIPMMVRQEGLEPPYSTYSIDDALEER